MKGEDIKQLITYKNEQINRILNPAQFVLQKDVQILMSEIQTLQEQCPHEYENHICKYCGKEE